MWDSSSRVWLVLLHFVSACFSGAAGGVAMRSHLMWVCPKLDSWDNPILVSLHEQGANRAQTGLRSSCISCSGTLHESVAAMLSHVALQWAMRDNGLLATFELVWL